MRRPPGGGRDGAGCAACGCLLAWCDGRQAAVMAGKARARLCAGGYRGRLLPPQAASSAAARSLRQVPRRLPLPAASCRARVTT